VKRSLKYISFVISIVLVISCFCSCGNRTVNTRVVEVTSTGNASLEITIEELNEKDLKVGDTVVVTIGETFKKEMPFVDQLIEINGKLQLFYDADNKYVDICIFNNNFCEYFGIKAGDTVIITSK